MSSNITDPNVWKLHQWIDSNKDALISSLQGALRIASLEDTAEPNAPFGPSCREALTYTLAICNGLGFSTHDDSGYAGHAEFGIGSEMVAALGHLDVVPEGDHSAWTDPPYSATIRDGYIYARGASDDKGPTYAALFGAAAILKTGLPLSRRVRVVFGCNEESGFGCVHHYWEVANNERPVAAFTPDSRFPLIYAEKGIANVFLQFELSRASNGLKIVKFSGGRRPNMVPDFAEATIEGQTAEIALAAETLGKFWDKNVSFRATATSIIIQAIGKNAHGARPDGGDNAVARLARAILSIGIIEWHSCFTWINAASDTAGTNLGIARTDSVAGPLTSNLGLASLTSDSKIELVYNIRYPVTWNIGSLLENLKSTVAGSGWKVSASEDQPPLHVPLDEEPVATLLRVYQEETGDLDSKPGTMGGGTYARATPHTVAFGAAFPGGSDGPAHEPDERIAIDTLIRAAKIYAHALYELAK